MVIAFRDFRDIEYLIPKDIFLAVGARVTTISIKKGIAIGADGVTIKIDITLDELNIDDFDALVFIGGSGAVKLIDNSIVNNLIQETIKKDKVLGAICIAPAILAKAGALKGKKATVWSSSLDKSAIKILKQEGAEYEDKNVVIDGKIVTGAGPFAAKEFGEKIVELLLGLAKQ